MPSPFLYGADDRLSTAELSAARLDGHLVEIGDVFMPADAVETRSLRAESLRPLLGDTLAATHLSAAWVYGAIPEPPSRHAVQRAVDRRLHHVLGNRLVYRDMCIDRADVTKIGGVWVSTPARTVADLARVTDATHAEAARLLVCAAPELGAEAERWLLSRGQLPFKSAALSLLRGMQTRSAA